MFVNTRMKSECKRKSIHDVRKCKKGFVISFWYDFKQFINMQHSCIFRKRSNFQRWNQGIFDVVNKIEWKKKFQQVLKNVLFSKKMNPSTTTWFEHATFGCLLPLCIEVRRASFAPRGQLYEDWQLCLIRLGIWLCAEANLPPTPRHQRSLCGRLLHICWVCHCAAYPLQCYPLR